MKPSPQLIEFLRHWEGPPSLKPRADPCAPGVHDIGYGHVCAADHPEVTLDWCKQTLIADVIAHAKIVDDALTVAVAQHEFDALVSFEFNEGPGKPGEKDGFIWLKNGNHSSLLRLVNEQRFDDAAEQFRFWNKSGGRIVNGLCKRRAAEKEMFLSGLYDARP